MKSPPQTIAIVGAGVAGSRLAYLLARNGKSVMLFDHKAPWEKPCGGGLSPKIVWEYPELKNLVAEGRVHRRLKMQFPFGRRVSLSLTWPMVTISRQGLGQKLLDMALAEGAAFHQQKVMAVEPEGEAMVLRTDAGQYKADFVVGADGVGSIVRKAFAGKFPREDLCLTHFALLPGKVKLPLVLRFFKGFQGYAWIFPRNDATAVGIALERGEAKDEDLSARLHEFVEDEFGRAGLEIPDLSGERAWFLPALRTASFEDPKLSGDGWALIGDASGSADPLTGEGIFYAFKTAELLGKAVCSEDRDGMKSYPQSWKTMARLSIGKVSRVTEKFYRPFTLRVIGFCLDYSPSVRIITRELVAGMQDYDTLKPKVKSDALKYAGEVVVNFLARQKGERKKKR
ncbi:MAG TPA: NAD(P)/FAD-dependent oxidoreductase [bacterium]|nr:NAD(P)/FAD-dependent oxidoreductase [bacterium]